MDFSLSLTRQNQKLKSDTASYKTNATHISLGIFEYLDNTTQTGLIIGNSYLSTSNDPATAGFGLNGYHLGLAIRHTIGKNPAIGLYAQYLFQEVKDSNELRTATLTAHEWLTEISVRLTVSPRLNFIIAGGPSGQNTERRIKGDINETLELKPPKNYRGRIALEFLDGSNGKIGLSLFRGSTDGASLLFSRLF